MDNIIAEVAAEMVLECNNCETKLNDRNRYEDDNGTAFCEDCYYKFYSSCNECGETVSADDILSHRDRIYCRDCHTNKFTACSGCNETMLRDSAVSHNNHDYCNYCSNDAFSICESCSENYLNNEGGPDNLCPSCDDDDNK